MKNVMKKLTALFMSIAIAIPAMTTSVSAEEVLYGLTIAPPSNSDGGISPQSNNMPTEAWDFSNGMYVANGKAVEEASLYTNYYFTNVNTLAISVTNRSNNALTVRLRKKTLLGNVVSSFTVPANGNGSKAFANLDPKEKYFFEFMAPCDFTANIA